MEAMTDSLTRSMQSEIDSLQALLAKSQSGAWVDYAIIIGFGLIALILIGKFMEGGPKKWLAYLGVLVGSMLGLHWLTKRRMRGVHDAYLKIKEAFAERHKIIEEKQRTINELRARMAELKPDIKEDRKTLADLDREIKDSERNMERAIADAEAKSLLAREKAERTLAKLPPAWRAELITPPEGIPSPSVELSIPLVADPAPPTDLLGDIIKIDGFIMKGDIE